MNPSWERRGFDMLLAHYPMATIVSLDRHEGRFSSVAPGPWVSVTLAVGVSRKEFGVWKETGAVYEVDRHGACADDPFLVPEGSSYDGPVAEPGRVQ